MNIHVVQKGETLQSIADFYGVSIDLVQSLNGYVETSGDLVQGQTLVIALPDKTYVVQNNDTLQTIADKNGVTVLELLRNNPYLSDRQYIYPNETLVISFGNKIRGITSNGYATVYIDRATLRKTLPYLTTLSIFGYRVTGNGDVADIDDADILQISKEYGVAPFLIITSISTLGQINVENAFTILNNEAYMDHLIDNLVVILKKKGYYGVNIAYELLTNLTLSAYETFHNKAYNRFKNEGLIYLVTISPNILFTPSGITFEKVDYSKIANEADGITTLSYLWGSFLGPPAPVASITKMNEFLDYISPMVLPGKLSVGIPLIAYDWELPYTIGLTKANSLALNSAIILAKLQNTDIQFNEPSQTPFFTYNSQLTGIPIEHVVWFVDARSMNGVLEIITQRGLSGGGLWNIMKYAPQMWAVINTQYEIEHIPEADLEKQI